MKIFESFREYNVERMDEFIKKREIKDYVKIKNLKSKLKTLDWDEYSDVLELWFYIYPKNKQNTYINNNLKFVTTQNLIDILYRIPDIGYIPELEYNEKLNKLEFLEKEIEILRK